jgi:hypothetical protein
MNSSLLQKDNYAALAVQTLQKTGIALAAQNFLEGQNQTARKC